MDSKPQSQPKTSPEREKRVAAALRENLRKRKAQQVERAELPPSRLREGLREGDGKTGLATYLPTPALPQAGGRFADTAKD